MGAPPIPVKTPLTNFKPPAYLDEKGQGQCLSSVHLSMTSGGWVLFHRFASANFVGKV